MIPARDDDHLASSNIHRRHHQCRLEHLMSGQSPSHAGALRTIILRSVSRSFYLSIRLLPQQLREPIGLAYLLARTTDTVADTTRIPRTLRMESLKMLA